MNFSIPSGDADHGPGNGCTWVKQPPWIKKSCGPWTTHGGVGYAVNKAPDQRSYPFGEWLVQREMGGGLTLDGELFAQGATELSGRSESMCNLGGHYALTPNFSLLISFGRTLIGESHALGYAGLYWTCGPSGPEECMEMGGT